MTGPIDHACPACRAAAGDRCHHKYDPEHEIDIFHPARKRVADAAEFDRYRSYLDRDLSPAELRHLEAGCPHIGRARQLRIIARCIEQEAAMKPGRKAPQREHSASTIALAERISERQVVRIHTAWRKGRLREVWRGWVNKHEGSES